MKWKSAAAGLGVLALLVSASASAQPVRAGRILEAELLPWARHDGVERPLRFILELRPWGDRPVDVVADRRLLHLEVREGRRVHRCRHPAAPAQVSAPRVRRLVPGEAEVGVGIWREWVDLRMYCTGAAYDAIARGAEVRARYGWLRGAPNRWVARRPDEPRRASLGGLDLPPFEVALPPPRRTRFADRPGPAPVELVVAPATARVARALVFTVRVRAREGSARLFVRPDFWSFRVRGPLGDVRCRAPMGGGAPPPELFRRVTARVAVIERLDPSYFCPAGTFELPGAYEVIPRLHLPHGGDEWGFEAVQGNFVGPSATVRVTHGEGGYVEQIPEPDLGRGADSR